MHTHRPIFYIFAGNNGSGDIVLEINNGKITFEINKLPHWALPLYDQFQEQHRIE